MSKPISLVTARKLKDAGLAWEPKEGDLRYYLFDDQPTHWCPICDTPQDTYSWKEYTHLLRQTIGHSVFAPTLEQLYDEGERRGYLIETQRVYSDGELIAQYRATIFRCTEQLPSPVWITYSFGARAGAAAEALLWILEQEALDELEKAPWPTFIRECREAKSASNELRDPHQPCREGGGKVEFELMGRRVRKCDSP